VSDILILTATGGEKSTLRDTLGGLEHTVRTHRNHYHGKTFGRDITLVEAGIGLTAMPLKPTRQP
jgi:hypothetical protein